MHFQLDKSLIRFLITLVFALFFAGANAKEQALHTPLVSDLPELGTLYGTSSYTFAGIEKYKAGLYVVDSEQGDQILPKYEKYKAMVFRIQASRISSREWSKEFLQQVAINANSNDLTEHSSELIDFLSVFKGPFTTGDRIVVVKDDKGGLSLSLNGIEFVRSKNTFLFDLMLSAWIGDVPPSTKFKQELTSIHVDIDHAKAFEKEGFDVVRQEEIGSWLKEQRDLEQKVLASTKEEVQKENDTAGRQMSERLEGQSAKSLTTLGYINIQAEPQEYGIFAFAADKQQWVSIKEKNKQMFTDLLERYRQEVNVYSSRFVRYPLRSQAKKEEGVVVLSVVLSRKGDLLDVKVKNSSSFSRLDKAALSAIKQASPFPEFPPHLDIDKMAFVLPMSFALQ